MGRKKILGVLGGMGPAASAEFMRILTQRFPAKCDQDHPVVYLLSDASIPDRNNYLTGKGENPQALIHADLDKLAGWGAELLAVTCNTAHGLINNFRDELKAPLIHIVEATVTAAKEKAPHGAWMVATLGTINCGLYQKEAEKQNFRLLVPPEDIKQKIQSIIRIVKTGDMKTAGEKMSEAVRELWKIEKLPVVTACTELPLAYDASGLSAEMNVSSLDALADACIKAIQSD
ncbi:MAG: amino acid racemase [Synergistaceae bacterium]|nr:amino acid racemase [Synergistaceae bacterium]